MTRTRWRDRPPIVEHPDEWGPFAVMAVLTGVLVVAVIVLWFTLTMQAATGIGWWLYLPGALFGGLIACGVVLLVVLGAVGFARLAQRTPTNLARFGVIAGGVALSLTLITAGPLALAGFPADALLPFPLIASVTGVFLAAGAVAPWRYGFARAVTAGAHEPRVP